MRETVISIIYVNTVALVYRSQERKLISDVMGTKNWHLCTFPPHQLAPKGLVAQLVEHHTGDVSVWVRYSSPEIFFSQNGNLRTYIYSNELLMLAESHSESIVTARGVFHEKKLISDNTCHCTYFIHING